MVRGLIHFIVTGGFIGKSRLMPGTLGSLLAIPIYWMMVNLTIRYKIVFDMLSLQDSVQEIISILIVLILTCLFLFILGVWLVGVYVKEQEVEDPKEVVIDEIVGQMLTMILFSPALIFIYNSSLPSKWSDLAIILFFFTLLPFAFFRLFDILKPWPINLLDQNVKGGFGVMIDDVAASFFAAICCYALTFLII